MLLEWYDPELLGLITASLPIPWIVVEADELAATLQICQPL